MVQCGLLLCPEHEAPTPGGAIYYTTRDEHKNMVLGPDGIWRPKPTPPKGVV